MIHRFKAKLLPPGTRQRLDLVLTLVRRELSVKYRGSTLGYLWSMANPLLFMLVISKVFSYIVKDVPHYHLFVLSGILFWNFTANSILGGTAAIVNGSQLMRKVKMPVWIFPVVPVLTFSSNFLLALIPYALIYAFSGPDHTPAYWQLPLLILLFLGFLCGVTLTLSALNVFFRDVGHVLEPLMVMVMYATPVIYDRHRPGFSEKVRDYLEWNPLTHFVEAGRSCLFWAEPMTPHQWLQLTGMTFVSLAIGVSVYRYTRDKFIFAI